VDAFLSFVVGINAAIHAETIRFRIQQPALLYNAHTSRGSANVRLVVGSSLLPNEGDRSQDGKSETSVTTTAEKKISVPDARNGVSMDDFDLDPNSLLSSAGTLVIVLLLGSIGLQLLGSIGELLGSIGNALAEEASRELSTFLGILLNLFGAIVASAFKILGVVVPFVGKGIANGATAAAPVAINAAQRVAESQAVRDAADAVVDAVAATAGPVLDAAGRAVDDGIVDPLREGVVAVVEPIQRAMPVVEPLPLPVMPDLPDLPSLPSMPDLPEASVSIGDVEGF